MSWSLSFSYPTKEEAHARVALERKNNPWFPAAIAESVHAAIDAVPQGLGVSVSSSGHLGDYLTSNLSVYSVIPPKEPA